MRCGRVSLHTTVPSAPLPTPPLPHARTHSSSAHSSSAHSLPHCIPTPISSHSHSLPPRAPFSPPRALALRALAPTASLLPSPLPHCIPTPISSPPLHPYSHLLSPTASLLPSPLPHCIPTPISSPPLHPFSHLLSPTASLLPSPLPHCIPTPISSPPLHPFSHLLSPTESLLPSPLPHCIPTPISSPPLHPFSHLLSPTESLLPSPLPHCIPTPISSPPLHPFSHLLSPTASLLPSPLPHCIPTPISSPPLHPYSHLLSPTASLLPSPLPHCIPSPISSPPLHPFSHLLSPTASLLPSPLPHCIPTPISSPPLHPYSHLLSPTASLLPSPLPHCIPTPISSPPLHPFSQRAAWMLRAFIETLPSTESPVSSATCDESGEFEPSARATATAAEIKTPLPIPPPSADAHRILLVAAVCRRWRGLTQRCVSALLVRDNLVVSRQALASAVAALPNLTHLHLCDGSVETLDDAFLAHLASSCPNLAILHVGSRITPVDCRRGYDAQLGKDEHPPITEAGLDRFFRQSTRLEQLALYCLDPSVEFPASFFQLPHLHTLALTHASPLESPDLSNLSSLTSLHFPSGEITYKQVASVARLPRITTLSISDEASVYRGEGFARDFDMAQLPLLKSLQFVQMLPAASPCASLERLDIVNKNLIGRLDELSPELLAFQLGKLTPSLRELSLRQRFAAEYVPGRITALPFTSLTLLESLTLFECNRLSSLPEEIGCLHALKTLVLHRLPLVALPDSLCHLPSLETFLLIQCITSPQVLQLPADFCCLTSLQTLAILRMPRVRLPENIGELSCLHTLYLNGQYQQPRLPLSFTQLTLLTRLELAVCTIQELPEGLGNLTSLRELHIRSCPLLQKLPESLTSLSSLETLTVDDCVKLFSIPRRLDSLGRLKWLELTGCPDQTQPPTSLPHSLEVLSFGNSYHAADLPDVSVLPWLRKLSLKLVGAEERMAVGSSLARVKQVELALQEEAVELPLSLALLPQLHTLVMWNAGKMQRLPSDMGWAVPQLRVLQIHCARELRELPDSIGAASRLRQLHLFDCPALHHLPASLTHLSCLHELHVENSGLRCLPSGIAQLTRLRSLSLHGCVELQGLPDDLTELKMLQYLGIKNCSKDVWGGWDAVFEPRGLQSLYGLRIECSWW
ncbi:unnamed protein product [Closterium sp. NIES-65]|nr:unnamed protein product [Closterium sp. NIES-65]